MIYGPLGCFNCGWSESAEYDCSEAWADGRPKNSDGGIVSPTGMLQPVGGRSGCVTQEEALAEADLRGYGRDFLPVD